MCFSAAPTKEWPFFAPKRPRIVLFGPKISFVGLACLVQAPRTLFCRCATEQEHVLQGMEARNMVFRGRPMQKMAIFAQKWPINSDFWPKTVFFGRWWSVHGRSTLFCRFLTQWNMCCRVWLHVLHGIEARKWVFQGHPSQKMGIFCPKMA